MRVLIIDDNGKDLNMFEAVKLQLSQCEPISFYPPIVYTTIGRLLRKLKKRIKKSLCGN